MAAAVKREPGYYDDGSSTESEPFGEDEASAAAPGPRGPAAAATAVPDGRPASSLSAPFFSSLSVLDLAPSPGAPVDATPSAPASAWASAPGDERETCAKCGKRALREAARLTPSLSGQQTLRCACCGLTLASLCFTALQRARASGPECRGCRGLPTVGAALTARVKKLLAEQQAPPRAARRPAAATTPSASAPASVASAAPSAEATAGAPANAGACSKCGKAKLSEAARSTAQLQGQETLRCACCGLTLASLCFTALQRARASGAECRGCRGVQSVGAALTLRVAKLLDEQQRPAAAAGGSSRKHPPCGVCQLPLQRVPKAMAGAEGGVQCSCCARALPALLYSNAQLRKEELRRCKGCLGHFGRPSDARVAAGLKAWRALRTRRSGEAEAQEKQEKRSKAQRREEGKAAVLRSRMQRHKLALAALGRKRADNDLRGATQTEYLKELAKEEAALQLQGSRLRQQNPTAFRQVMRAKVKRPRVGKDEKEDEKDEDWSEDEEEEDKQLELNRAAPAYKRRRTSEPPAPAVVVDLTVSAAAVTLSETPSEAQTTEQ